MGNFRVVQNFVIFADQSDSVEIAASAISTALCLPVRVDAAKLKPQKFLLVPSRRFQENFAPVKTSRYRVLHLKAQFND